MRKFTYLRMVVKIRNKANYSKLQIQKAQQYIDKYLDQELV